MKLKMLKTAVFMTGLLILGCATEPSQPGQDAAESASAVDTSRIQVYLEEEPTVEYEDLGDIGRTIRAEHPAQALERIVADAAELGADGVIVHSIRNQGRVGGGTSTFGVGGRTENFVFQVQATAIRYTEQP